MPISHSLCSLLPSLPARPLAVGCEAHGTRISKGWFRLRRVCRASPLWSLPFPCSQATKITPSLGWSQGLSEGGKQTSTLQSGVPVVGRSLAYQHLSEIILKGQHDPENSSCSISGNLGRSHVWELCFIYNVPWWQWLKLLDPIKARKRTAEYLLPEQFWNRKCFWHKRSYNLC